MTQPSNGSQAKQKSSLLPQERVSLIRVLNAVPVSQIYELEFALQVPHSHLPGNDAVLARRTKALLDWVEGITGIGWPPFFDCFEKVTGISPDTIGIPKNATGTLSDVIRANSSLRALFKISSATTETDIPSFIRAILPILREKVSDPSIEITFITEDHIQLYFQGSPEGLRQLVSLVDSEQLPELLGRRIQFARLFSDLTHANLSYASLSTTDLSYANLSYANLSHTNLSYADLSYANLSHANLSYINLNYADLSHANLSYADLSHANLNSTNLNSTNLSSTNLRKVSFGNANLSKANLRNANFNYADLGANEPDSAYTGIREAELPLTLLGSILENLQQEVSRGVMEYRKISTANPINRNKNIETQSVKNRSNKPGGNQ